MKSDRFLERFDFRDEYLASREIKAEKIIRVLEEELPNTSLCSLLDVGCSQGQITQRLTRNFRFVVGVDRDWEQERQRKDFHFVQADGTGLPFFSSTFEVVLLNHVLEHVQSSEMLLDEVWRVLKAGGLVYLACPNRYSLIEPHYRLPLLSWFPRPLADLYVRMAGRGREYLDQLPSYWQLIRWTRRFRVKNLTVPLLKHPGRFFADDPKLMAQASRAKWFPSFLLELFVPWLPVWVLVMRKPFLEATNETGSNIQSN
jgi:SAM-dependent methyltransferase